MADTSNIISGAVNGGNKSSANTGRTATDLMSSQAVYEGTVTAVDLELRTLVVDTGSVTLNSCEYLPGCVAGLLGFSINSLPPVGTRVVVLRGRSQNYVIAAQQATGAKTPDTTGFATGFTDADPWKEEAFNVDRAKAGKQIGGGMHEAVDMFPGELDLTNSMGVALRALHNFAALSAGDAAKVETHLFNAMVRIVSGYFVHHSVGGDTMIWSNGGCNKEEHFTSYQFEADGKKDETETYAQEGESTNVYDPKESCDDIVNDTGRWRLSRYTGFLGDLIHTFVSTPTDVISTYNKGAYRNGQFRASVGADGMVAVQAHGGVFVQVTPRIQVPVMFHKWDDPEFDAEEAFKNLNSEYLKLWGSGPDWKNLEFACWQMRSYLRYIMQYHSLQRFLQLKDAGVCEVPVDTETAGKSAASEEDKKSTNGSDASYPWYREASISIDPSGSITIESNQHASIILNQGNIQIAAAGNLELKAGGTVSIQGRDMSILSASDMEIVSMAGKIAMKARTAWKVLCEMGRIWLKSDAEEGAGEDTEVAGVKSTSEMGEYAIVLDASKGKTLVSAKEQVTVGAETGDLYLSSLGGSIFAYCREMKFLAQAKLLLSGLKVAIAGKTAAIMSNVVQLTQSVRVTSGGILTDKIIKCNGLVSSGYVAGPKDQKQLAPSNEGTPKGSDPGAAALGKEAEALSKADVYSDYIGSELDKAIYSLRAWDDVIATDKAQTESLKASLVDDYYLNAGMPLMQEVDAQYTKLKSATRTQPSHVFPGAGYDSSLFVWQNSKYPSLDLPLGQPYEGPGEEGDLVASSYIYLVREPKREYPYDSTGVE